MTLQLTKAKGKKKALREADDDIDDSNEDENELFTLNASKLDVEISFNDPKPKETFGDIMGKGGPGAIGEIHENGGGPELSQEEFLKEFQREAGSIRKGPSIAENE
jgi:hypothetical protein|tara:strand:- start:22 stop:339 length:318 start_codon:yes stop_codon:yes gene_type:complete